MVALIGRELYESSQTKTPPLECPICKKLPLDPDKGPENQNRNLTGSCFDDKKFPNDQKKFQFEQNFKLNEYQTCCSLDLRKYMFLDPYIILVWCFVMKLFQNIFLCIFCAKINWIFARHVLVLEQTFIITIFGGQLPGHKSMMKLTKITNFRFAEP